MKIIYVTMHQQANKHKGFATKMNVSPRVANRPLFSSICPCPLLRLEMTPFVLYFEIILTGSSISCSQDVINRQKRLLLVRVQTLSTLHYTRSTERQTADQGVKLASFYI